MATADHPLAGLLRDAAHGNLPPADGSVDVIPAAPGPVHAVLAFTAHSVVAADIDADDVYRRLPADDLGAPMSPAFLLFLASWLGSEPGVIDVVLAAIDDPEDAGVVLWRRDDLDHHPRVARAHRYRDDVAVYGDRESGEVDGLVLLGRGLAGRWELAYEVEPHARGAGLGRRIARAARTLVPAGEPLFAQASPGNAASLRSLLAAGFTVIGSEVLFAKVDRQPSVAP